MHVVALAALAFSYALRSGNASADGAGPSPSPIVADAIFTATTDYVSRGLSQTDGGPALQATLELRYAEGPDWLKPMAGIFGSNVNFPGADSEVDPYLGTRGTVAEFNYELVGIYYAYPDARRELKFQFFEFGGSVSRPVAFFTPTIGVLYSPDFFADSGKQLYPFASVRAPFTLVDREWSVSAKFARRMIERNDRFLLPDYNTWLVSLGTTAFGFAFSLNYADTSIREELCLSKICNARVAFEVSKRF